MNVTMPDLFKMPDWQGYLLEVGIMLAVAGAAGWVLHWVIFSIIKRLADRSKLETEDRLLERLRRPSRWLFVALAVSFVAERVAFVDKWWTSINGVLEPALVGWVAYNTVKVIASVLNERADLVDDQVALRSRRTRIAIISRTMRFMVLIVTTGVILLALPGVRTFGATLMASAGLLTLAVGAAAQPALKSLVAGIQIAISEPIRIDDYVVIDGEAGRIEDIKMSYVVIRTADERRVIVPTSKFLDGSFQNWTRVGGGITGSITLPVRPNSDIGPIRDAYTSLIAAHHDWDKRTGTLHVAEARVGSIDLKLVMSAANPAALGRLRSEMREAMLDWLRTNMPDAICNDPA